LGRFVFGNTGNSISAFAITSNPSLSFIKVPNSPFGNGFLPVSVDPNGNFLIALNQLPTTIATFRINPDGSLTQTNGLTFPFIPGVITLDPSGKFLYIDYQGAGNDYHLLTMQVDSSGNLTQTNSDQVFAGPGLNFQTFSIAFIPKSDNFLFAYLTPTANTLELAAFPIDVMTGAVNPSAVFTMPVQFQRAFTLDISGQRVFDTVGGNPNQPGEILTYTIDPKTGQLAMAGQPTQTPCCLSGLAAIP
jgi:6-phosphogluconolactonase (cycloisomerase 2 family)